MMEMMLDLLDARDAWQQRQRQHSAILGASSSTITVDVVNTSIKASKISYFFPNMLLDQGDKDVVEKDGKLYY